LEWLLQRSRLQADLGKHEDRIRALQAAGRENPSAVLDIELIEAQIDAGHSREVLPQIEAELADSRRKSSWLLRRARAWQQLGRTSEAKADLEAAVDEINERLHPTHPDPGLLADRGLAHALLGNRQEAQADLRAAKANHADAWTVAKLEQRLKSEPPDGAASKQPKR
jgi:tetratricopeptide (TPR) repeat protein